MSKQGFLLMTRRPGERVLIAGGEIEIEVNSIHRGHVSLAIRAPGHSVWRPGKEQDTKDRAAHAARRQVKVRK